MTQKVKVILNPHKGRLSQAAKIKQVEQALQRVHLDYNLEVTHHPQHATELARQAALEGWPIIVAAGGDGTINEVVNGLLQVDSQEPAVKLGIIPIGTANDLADMLHLPRDIINACRRLATGNCQLIDVGEVNGHYFVNNSAVGLEPLVTIAQEKLRWLGASRYFLAALKTIWQAQSWQMRLDWLNGTYEGSVTLVSIGNSPRTGGLFFMTPQAVVDDGLLDFVYGSEMYRWQLLSLLPQTLWGNHIHHPLVIYKQTTYLKITASPATPIQADGEIIDLAATEIHYRLLPGKLPVIV